MPSHPQVVGPVAQGYVVHSPQLLGPPVSDFPESARYAHSF